jgi:hypothetical protein
MEWSFQQGTDRGGKFHIVKSARPPLALRGIHTLALLPRRNYEAELLRV